VTAKNPTQLIFKAGPGKTPGRFWLVTEIAIFTAVLIPFFLTSCMPDQSPTITAQVPAVETTLSAAPPIYLQNTNPKEFYELTIQNAKTGEPVLNNSPTNTPINPGTIWGVTVPHHLLAADLTAAALKKISPTGYNNIFILSPDHYNHGKTVITIADKKIKTTVGKSAVNPEIIAQLTKLKKIKINNTIFPVEHGISAVLPFSQILWPEAKITPILIRSDANAADLEDLLQFLQQQISVPGTLIIQSSDFSHYLTAEQAKDKDRQTIAALLSNDPKEIMSLNQPANCDSVNILYLMKSIRQNTGSKIQILENKNSQDYIKTFLKQTTSYITIIFNR
jgi:poly-gamma-glutamate synthesis protein (capsule biosynthesis protein)